MKNIFFLTLISFMLGLFAPAFSYDRNSSYMSLDEYSALFELGFMSPEEKLEEEEIPFSPKEKEKISTEGEDVIDLESKPVSLRIEKIGFPDSYKKVQEVPTTRVDLLKSGNFTLFSNGTKELSDYMTNNLKTTMNMSYDFGKLLYLGAGYEIWYVNPNASVGAKKFYLNPRLNLTERCFVDYTGKYNQVSKNIEQEVGFIYKPKLFKEIATFGVKASAVINESSEVLSKKLKFTTDLYIY